MMSVFEVLMIYGLEDYKKHYKNCYGNYCDVTYRLDELYNKQVKSIDINFPTKSVVITII